MTLISGRRSRRIGTDGQSSVEFALVLPLLLGVAALIVQVGLVVAAQLSALHTAREVARVVSVDPGADPAAVGHQVMPFGWNPAIASHLEPVAGTDRTMVVVTVSDDVPSIIGIDLPGRRVSATIAMAVEYDP